MKLNKQTIEYIHSLVEGKAKPKKDAADAEVKKAEQAYESHKKEFEAAIDAFNADTAKKAAAILKKFGVGTSTDWRGEHYEIEVSVNNIGKNEKLDKAVDAAKDKRAELDKKVDAAVTEVVAKLTLGGTAADLESLIAELKF